MIRLPRHFRFAWVLIAAGVVAVAAPSDSVMPEYRLGDIATADVVSPATIRVVNPARAESLKQENAAQVPPIFRQLVTAPDDAETELRASVDAARTRFLTTLRAALGGRMSNAHDVDSPSYAEAIREAEAADPNGPPLAPFAPFWVGGSSDAPVVDALVRPIREVMAQAIASDDESEPLSLDQPIRVIPVKSRLDAPGLTELETGGLLTQAAKLSNVAMARSVVMSSFSPAEQATAQYVARFVRANTFAAPGLTELVRSRRRDAAAAYDTYAAGQVIVRKGQPIDGKALAVLAALREKHLLEALLTKVEPKPSETDPLITDSREFALWAGGAGLLLLLILWRWGGSRRHSETAESVRSALGSSVAAERDSWRTRALLAEQQAERAHDAIREGALGWMKEKVFRAAVHQRADLIASQEMAEAEMLELEQRMARLFLPLQERIKAYEERINELEAALAEQKGDDHRLIDARINRARRQLELELERARTEQNF